MCKRILSIDPGLRNLGWVVMEGKKVVRYGNDNLGYKGKPGIKVLNKHVVEWVKMRQDVFTSVDHVIVEQQFLNKNQFYGKGTFWPMTVMYYILALAEYLKPGTTDIVNPSAVKKRYKIYGDYDARKAQVVERFGKELPNAGDGRWHDCCDCIINAWYWQEKQDGQPVAKPPPVNPEAVRDELRKMAPLKPKTTKGRRLSNRK